MTVVESRADWTLPATLSRAVDRWPDSPFLHFAAPDTSLSFGETGARVEKLAAGLQRLGVGPGDNVLVMVRNRAEFVLAWFAVNTLGAVEVPVNVDYHGYFLEHLVNTSRASVMVVEADFLDSIEASAARFEFLRTLVVVGASPGAVAGFEVHSFAEVEAGGGRPTGDPPRYSDLAAIHVTSGTTGPSKGAMMTHAHAHLLAERNQSLIRMEAGDVLLTHLPLFHVNAQLTAVYNAMLVGAAVHLQTHFSASHWLEEIRSSGATHTTLLGVMMPFILKQEATPLDADNALRCVWAVPCPPEPAEAFRRRFDVARIVSAYGNTEIGMISTQDFDEARLGSAGRVDGTWYEVRIVDPDTDEELPTDTVGELVVRPRHPWNLCQGYFGMPERTLETFRNLWFHTGDALRMDEDGYLYFVDRIKDRIRRRAENIASVDVEHVIVEHDAVAEAAVVAVPSELEGGEDELKACVVLSREVDLAEVREWCDRRLPYFAVPRYVEALDALPKTPTAKVRKFQLREAGITPGTVDFGKPEGRSRRVERS
ncbi:MAG TPA: AMP-binding protein [Acidimicrobiia bacterium]|nr:AMP-binding protein [Acidimicrobiia bacterium]